MSESHNCRLPRTESDASGPSTIEDVPLSTFSCSSGSCFEDVVEECKTADNAIKRICIRGNTCSNTDNVSVMATTVTSQANARVTFDQENMSESEFGNGKKMLSADMDVSSVEEITETDPRDVSLDVPAPLHMEVFATDKDISNFEECTEVTCRNDLGSVPSKSDIQCIGNMNAASNEGGIEVVSSDGTISADSESDIPFTDDANIEELPLNTKIARRGDFISVLPESNILFAADMGIINFKECTEVTSQNDSVNIEAASNTDLFFPADMNVANFEECDTVTSQEHTVSISSKRDVFAAEMNVAYIEESANIALPEFLINIAAVPSNSDIVCSADIEVANFEECSENVCQGDSITASSNSDILFPAGIEVGYFEECSENVAQDDSVTISSNSEISFVNRNAANFEERSSKPSLWMTPINISIPSNNDIFFPVNMEVANFEEYPPVASLNDSVHAPSNSDISFVDDKKVGNFEERCEVAAAVDSITTSSNNDALFPVDTEVTNFEECSEGATQGDISFIDRNVANFEECSSEPALCEDSKNIALPSNSDIFSPVDMEDANFEEYSPVSSRDYSVSDLSENDVSCVDDMKVGSFEECSEDKDDSDTASSITNILFATDTEVANFEECSEGATQGDSVTASSNSDILFPADVEVANVEECSEVPSRNYSINFVVLVDSNSDEEERVIEHELDKHQAHSVRKEFPNYAPMFKRSTRKVTTYKKNERLYTRTIYSNRSTITANEQDSADNSSSSNVHSISVVTYMYVPGILTHRRVPSTAVTENQSAVPEVYSTFLEEDGIQCSICFDAERPEDIERTPCGHRFHDTCLRKWLSRKQECPICRNKISVYASNDDIMYRRRMVTLQTTIRENIHEFTSLLTSLRERARRVEDNVKRNLDSRK